MEKNHGFGAWLGSFFAGKGFYIVLILCVAVIGASAWIMLAEAETDVENEVLSVNGEPDNAFSAAVELTPVPETSSGESAAPDTEETIVCPPEIEQPEAAQPVSNPAPAFIWPITGEIEVPYAMETLRYDRTMGDWRAHAGVDILAQLGDKVMAVSSGTVEKVYTDALYGVTVVIDHGSGLRSVYSNLAETPTVYAGDSVTVGEVIGAVGTSALAEIGEACHLHFAMTRDGAAADPTEILPAR